MSKRSQTARAVPSGDFFFSLCVTVSHGDNGDNGDNSDTVTRVTKDDDRESRRHPGRSFFALEPKRQRGKKGVKTFGIGTRGRGAVGPREEGAECRRELSRIKQKHKRLGRTSGSRGRVVARPGSDPKTRFQKSCLFFGSPPSTFLKGSPTPLTWHRVCGARVAFHFSPEEGLLLRNKARRLVTLNK